MKRQYPERIRSYLQDVLDSAALLKAYLRPYSRETFSCEDEPSVSLSAVRDSVVRRLEIIGQALHNIQTADPEYVRRNQLDVSGWYGSRSKISHGYESVDYRLLWGVVRLELPALVARVQHCIDQDALVIQMNRPSSSHGHIR